MSNVVFEKICAIIAEQFSIDENSITMETSFEEDLNADSLDIVELTMAIEEEFDLGELEDGEFSSMVTVGDIVRFVESKLD